MSPLASAWWGATATIAVGAAAQWFLRHQGRAVLHERLAPKPQRRWTPPLRRSPRPSPLAVWADALTIIARELRSGASLAQAVSAGSAVAPREHPLRSVVRQWQQGASLAGAVAGCVSERSPAHDRLAFSLLQTAAIHGVASGAPFDRCAVVLREQQALADEQRVMAAQARLSARVLTIIPPLFCGWSVISDERVRGFLLGTPAGLACAVVGVVLNLAGWAWMRRLVAAPI